MQLSPRAIAWCGAACLLSCDSAPPPAPVAAPVDPRRCKPGPGTTGSPGTIEEAVALANALPFPVSAECLVESLDRPLRLEATSSRSSVQPAAGARSPRVFIWTTDSFVIALAVDGPGRDLIEFGQFVTPRRSIKGELAFPLTQPVTVATALDRVRNAEHPEITSCFVCHDRERDEPTVPGGRSSLSIRPHPKTLVDVTTLRDESQRCDPSAEPARCRWLRSIVGHGAVEHRPFDVDLPLF
ncbi:MAG: hypothetical protein AAF721_07650 [Myxococcota bacterium]